MPVRPSTVRPPAAARPSTAARLSAAAVCGLLLTGCAAGQEAAGGSAAPAAAGSGAATSSPPSSSASAPSASPSAAPTPRVRTIEAAYAGGEVTGTSGREAVAVGEQVVLRVSSDVAEEVHVHGYDLSEAVPAGGTVDIPVQATIPGVFEVELHDSGKLLFQLRVA